MLGFYSVVGVKGLVLSFSGWIGLHGNNDDNAAPTRSFYWYFEAREGPDDAPIHARARCEHSHCAMIKAKHVWAWSGKLARDSAYI
ncbi:hypothetical protein P691DRAFT_478523 [Macrolepiota fuliginosa MF-IS2]|uniref:Uncharacterized protein n=1 Tax=Macrolepiota fuliginosa MF-IS2 TaxID=1400762 RepID=A0A9P5X0F1_9AGAR|nr:hypothetical protein P691DRAFT_478523 [Macrolepiota fuliginosa MF-IS2]